MSSMIEFERKWNSSREKLAQKLHENNSMISHLKQTEAAPDAPEPQKKEKVKQSKPRRITTVPVC